MDFDFLKEKLADRRIRQISRELGIKYEVLLDIKAGNINKEVLERLEAYLRR